MAATSSISRLAFLCMMLGGIPAPSGAQAIGAGTGEIRGRILDSLSGSPVHLVRVALPGTGLIASTGRAGSFVIHRVPPGEYVLEARAPGYASLVREGIRVTGDSTVELELVMRPLPVRLQDVVVSPGAFAFVEAGAATRQVMTREDIASVPQFGEDIFRAVTRLPGLASGDYTAHFGIRGGRHDETLIVLDGLEIHEPYHLKDFHEGAISIVDAEAVEGVELLTGGFPAKYGNKRSGVFRITSQDPRGGDTRASLGLSFINARGMAQGTFARERGSWFVSARRGYMDLVLGLLSINDIPSPAYHDVLAKVRYDLHPNHSLSFNILHARDRYTLDGDATTGFADSILTREVATNRYGNSYAWLTLRSALGPKVSVTSLASAGVVTASRDGSEFRRVSPDTFYAISNARDFQILGFEQDWLLEVSDRVLMELGYDLRRLDAAYAITNKVWQNPDDPSRDSTGYYPQEMRNALMRDGSTVAGYLGSRWRPVDPLTLELGLRYDRAAGAGDADVSPRVNALLRLAPASHLRLGWGHYRQSQGIADLAALDGLGRYFPSELSRQWRLGFEHLLAGEGTLRLEAYHKRGSHLRPVFRNWKGSVDVFPETDNDRILVYPEATTSRGMEVYYTRDLGSRFSVRGSYALSFVEEEVRRVEAINDPTPLDFARTHPAPQDQRHALDLDLVYRPASSWSVNASLKFHTGWPATLERQVQVTDSAGRPDVAVKPDSLYGSRLPYYQRMDVRVTKRTGNLRLFLELLNVTNHENVWGYDYFRARGAGGQIVLQRDPETWFTILPSIGVSWSKSF
jgi:outer membrane receptor protein involved in Fe transport